MSSLVHKMKSLLTDLFGEKTESMTTHWETFLSEGFSDADQFELDSCFIADCYQLFGVLLPDEDQFPHLQQALLMDQRSTYRRTILRLQGERAAAKAEAERVQAATAEGITSPLVGGWL